MQGSDIVPALVAVAIVAATLAVKVLFRRNTTLVFSDSNNKGAASQDLTARYRPMRPLPLMLITLGIAAWIAAQVWIIYQHSSFDFEAFYLSSGIVLIVQLFLAVAHRPYKGDEQDESHVVVLIPVYNEHEQSLRGCLEALLKQTRLPDEIYVVDDGSTQSYSKVRTWFKRTAKAEGVSVAWTKQKNQGKRVAHVTALANVESRENTIIVTIDFRQRC